MNTPPPPAGGQPANTRRRLTYHRWTAEEDARLVELAATAATAAEIARVLGVTARAVAARLRTCGLVRPAVRRIVEWTPEEDARLEALIAGGLTIAAASLAVGRSAEAGRRRLETRGLTTRGIRARRHREVYSATQAGLVLGLSQWRARDLIAIGALPVANAGRKGEYRIPRAVLLAFVQDRRWWMLWTPAAITDGPLRQVAELARAAAAPHRWLDALETGRRLGYAAQTVDVYCQRGQIPGVKVCGRWYCWTADLDLWLVRQREAA
jgi:hypothetical protein